VGSTDMTIVIENLDVLIVAILVLFLGRFLTNKIQFLDTYNIPPAVTGGIICSLLIALLQWGWDIHIVFNLQLRDLFLLFFFSTIGLGAKLKVLAAGGRELRDACIKSDAKGAALSLLSWAVATWPDQPPRSLGALTERVNHGTEAIRELENALYSGDNINWNGQGLWTAFKQGFISPAGTSETRQSYDDAPPLYPDWYKKAG